MTKTYVALNDGVHSLLRSLTRRTPLVVAPAGDSWLPQYRIRDEELPPAYYSLAIFHTLGGLSLAMMRRTRWRANLTDRAGLLKRVNYFDAVNLDRRCCRDLRFKLRKDGPGMLSADLLCFGTGMLRACNDDSAEQLYQYLWSHHGRLRSQYEVVYAKIRALHRNSLPLFYQNRKETFESTNVIYGDALGELEQLWDRRADTSFLDQVTRSLQPMRARSEIAAFLHPPLNLQSVMQLHLRAQALWKKPPASGRALLRRVERVLDHTAVDDIPCTLFRRHECETAAQSLDADAGGGGSGWRADASGYDGWLKGGE